MTHYVNEQEVRVFWRKQNNHLELWGQPCFIKFPEHDEIYIIFRFGFNDENYVDLYGVRIDDPSATPVHFFFKYEKTKIRDGIQDSSGRDIVEVEEDKRITTMEIMLTYGFIDGSRTSPSVRIEKRDYFVIDMKSSVVREKQYITLTLIDKEYGLKKDLVYRANTLWEKADNNFYIDTKKVL